MLDLRQWRPPAQHGLLLLGHGSMVSAQTAQPVREVARALRAQGRWSDVQVAFWKQAPSLHDAIVQMRCAHVTVVPLFMAQGYFTSTVLPREVRAGCARIPHGVHARCAPPVGIHDGMRALIRARVARASEASGVPEASLALMLVGHGTARHARSSALIWAHVEALRNEGLIGAVEAAFLDEDPVIPSVLAGLSAHDDVVVVPYFLANGYHAAQDIPELLGIEWGAWPATAGAQRIWYEGALGEDVQLAQVVEQVAAHVDEAMEWEVQPTGAALYARRLPARLRARQVEGRVVIGELCLVSTADGLHLTHVDEQGQELPALSDDDVWMVGGVTPSGVARSVPYIHGIRRGWSAHATSWAHAVDLIHAIYPNVLLHELLNEEGLLAHDALEMFARQTGQYRRLKDVSEAHLIEASRATCSTCVRVPVWAGQDAQQMPCSLPCHAVMDLFL